MLIKKIEKIINKQVVICHFCFWYLMIIKWLFAIKYLFLAAGSDIIPIIPFNCDCIHLFPWNFICIAKYCERKYLKQKGYASVFFVRNILWINHGIHICRDLRRDVSDIKFLLGDFVAGGISYWSNIMFLNAIDVVLSLFMGFRGF